MLCCKVACLTGGNKETIRQVWSQRLFQAQEHIVRSDVTAMGKADYSRRIRVSIPEINGTRLRKTDTAYYGNRIGVSCPHLLLPSPARGLDKKTESKCCDQESHTDDIRIPCLLWQRHKEGGFDGSSSNSGIRKKYAKGSYIQREHICK